MPAVAELNPLATFGINVSEADRIRVLSPEDRLSEVYQGLMGYKKEVLEDSAVSIPYSYWFGTDRRLYTHSNHQDELRLAEGQIDIRERGGLPLEGFRALTHLLRENPNEVILWYSPPGDVSFDKDPNSPYTKVAPYKNGQLYLQYLDSLENRVQSFAITVSNDSIIQDLMPNLYRAALEEQQYQDFISVFLRNPVITGVGINEFLSGNWAENLGTIVYKHHDGRVSTVFDVLAEIRETLSGKGMVVDEHALYLAQELAYSKPTQERVLKMYLQFIHRSMKGNQIQLAGSCGGRVVERDSIESLLGITNSFTNIYSTAYRLETNPLEINNNSTHYKDYDCPECGKTYPGESMTNKANWRKQCFVCGYNFNC